MAFGEVGDLLEQKVHRNFKPRSPGSVKEKNVSLFIKGRIMVVFVDLSRNGLVTYNSTPEMSPG